MRRSLEMHAAKGSTLDVVGRAVLHEDRFQPALGKFPHAEGPCEKAALVTCGLGRDQTGSGKR
jgi:hypothetical protein